MSVTVRLEHERTGREILAAFSLAASFDERGRDYRGLSTTDNWRWVVGEHRKYDGIIAEAELYRQERKYLLFGPLEWCRSYSEASGPATLRLQTIRPEESYENFELSLGRRLDGARGFADGWHEHLEYDDVCYGPSVQMVLARITELLRQSSKITQEE